MTAAEVMSLALVVAMCAGLMLGYPVAFTLGGVSILFALLGYGLGTFDLFFLNAVPARIFGIMTNEVLVAVPLFVFMGVMLERSRIAEDLLETMAQCFGARPGGLAISVTLVGALLAASTGIVGATVTTMGLLSLPLMLRSGYDPKLASGTICASGTLGQIIPPSIALVIIGDALSGTYTEAQLAKGNFLIEPFSVIDLFAGALIPGLMLAGLYVVYIAVLAWLRPETCPPSPIPAGSEANLAVRVVKVLLPPVALIVAVLGSILGGLATPTESASFGGVGAMLLAAMRGLLTWQVIADVSRTTARISAMVFAILIGASLFSLTFRGFGGDHLVHEFLASLPGGFFSAMLLVMVVMFLLGFVLDFVEIVFIVVPIVAPALFRFDVDPVWLGVMLAINLQTSFLTPPFGWALFFMRGVAPPQVTTTDIYSGVAPFIGLQLLTLALVWMLPGLATWLPRALL
ncbi:MAG: TRAP transporter large permease subunit [Hyphomicrobiaceae bacterium]|nr:TRAP transporter large permease subunit [Hyphomicrobiaceae bacterium]